MMRSEMSKPIAKVTDLQYLLRNEMLNCYDLLRADRLTLRLNLDSAVRLAQQTLFLGVAI